MTGFCAVLGAEQGKILMNKMWEGVFGYMWNFEGLDGEYISGGYGGECCIRYEVQNCR
jgi:hypothetical protein